MRHLDSSERPRERAPQPRRAPANTTVTPSDQPLLAVLVDASGMPERVLWLAGAAVGLTAAALCLALHHVVRDRLAVLTPSGEKT